MTNLIAAENKKLYQRQTGQDVRQGILGDLNGVIYEPGRDGWVRVRFPSNPDDPEGRLYTPYTLARVGGVFEMNAGDAVLVNYDQDGELSVTGIDFQGQVAQGRNPLAANPADKQTGYAVTQDQIMSLRSHAVSTPGTPTLEVALRCWVYIRDNVAYWYPGELLDASGEQPATNTHRLFGLFVTPDNTSEIVSSTAQSETVDLDLTDVQELLDAASPFAVPAWAWRIRGDASDISGANYDTGDNFLDMRQFINVPSIAMQPDTISWTAIIKSGQQAQWVDNLDITGSLDIQGSCLVWAG